MSQVPKLCNDMMNLGRLQGYEVRLWLWFKYMRQYKLLVFMVLIEMRSASMC